MNDYFTLLIVTNKDIKIPEGLDAGIVHGDFCFIDDLHIQINNKIYEYNYLIFTDEFKYSFSDSHFFTEENNTPLVNYEKQTELEYIYYCKPEEIEEIIQEMLNE